MRFRSRVKNITNDSNITDRLPTINIKQVTLPVQFTFVIQTSVMFLILLAMFNLLLQKTKKLIEKKTNENGNAEGDSATTSVKRFPVPDLNDIELKETVYGKWRTWIIPRCFIVINKLIKYFFSLKIS